MSKISCACSFCSKPLMRYGPRKQYFCDIGCKSEWQKTQRPVSNDWIRQKYEVEGLDCTQIARLVKRDPKSVWNWVKDIGIETRKRGFAATKPFAKGHKLGVGRVLSEETRDKIRQARFNDKRVPCYVNGVHWMHHYNRKPASWRGGITPERQSFYATKEWRDAAKIARKRDNFECQICGLKWTKQNGSFDLHHIISFEHKPTRADPANLILLCEPCHYWTHSRKNKKKLHIKPTPCATDTK